MTWKKINASCYREEKHRITVALKAPRYFDGKGNMCPSTTWILYRDSNGFCEGEFATAEQAMAAAET